MGSKFEYMAYYKSAFFLFPPPASMQPNDVNEIKSFCISYIDLQTVPPNFTLQSAVTIFPSDNRSLPTTSDLTSPVIPSPFSLNTPRNICENLPISPPTTSADPSPSTIQDSHFFFADLLRVSEMSSPENVAQEVERYSSEIVRMTEDFDLIEWWRNHSNVYPQLSKFALQIHSIPASSAASERAFSLAGNIITEKRNRIGPKTVDNLLFLHSMHKNFNKLQM